MNVIYALQPIPLSNSGHILPNSIFLAGPTPRVRRVPLWKRILAELGLPVDISDRPPSWRPDALAVLEQLGFTGTVFVPEEETWGLNPAVYSEQTRWELRALGTSAAIVFWVPRTLRHMPAFTTNTEFGFCVALAPKRTVFGAPASAVKVGYQKQLAQDINLLHQSFLGPTVPYIPPIMVRDTLEATLKTAILLARPT